VAQRGRAGLSALFPSASPLLLDLVGSLLQFDARKRPTAEQALAHPYLMAYRDAPDDTAEVPHIEMDFEGRGASKEELRELVWREMCHVRMPDRKAPSP
jgi:serine/threonine protein kinase